MAPDEHVDSSPASSVSVGIAPTVDHAIPLPPLPAPSERSRPEVAAGRSKIVLDALLLLILLTLAFLLASIPARNSDLFLHLGTGKLLAEGKYSFGVDPFAQTTAGLYWANTNWLFDLIAFAVQERFPAMGLVVLKGLLLVLTAAVLVIVGRRRKGGWWLPLICAGLAILAVGMRVPVSPVCFSYFLLALLLYLLERPLSAGVDGGERPWVSAWAYWPIPLVFAAWVNLDVWFQLGLWVLGMYVVGTALQNARQQQQQSGPRVHAGTLAIILIASTAACLLSPHHFHVFAALPTELGLSGAYAVLKTDPVFRDLVTSPFQSSYFYPSAGLNVTGLTYFVLVGLGLFALALNFADLRVWHLATWVSLFLLSAYQARLIPFFAIASAPIIALNFQSWYARQPADGVKELILERWQSAGRVLTLLIGALLLALAWPGWLQPAPYDVRSWNVDGDTTLPAVAAQLRQWHQQGTLSENTRGFVLSPETAHNLAWLCPEEKGFIDSRLGLFMPETARDYLSLRAALLGAPSPDGDGADTRDPRYRQVLRRHRIDHLVLHDNERRMKLLLSRLSYPGIDREFPLLYLDNNTAIYGWRDPDAEAASPSLAAIDLNRQAFHPSAEKRAPREWPGREPAPSNWYDAWIKPRLVRCADCDEGELFLTYFDAQRLKMQIQHEQEWTALSAALPFSAGLRDSGLAGSAAFTARLAFASALTRNQADSKDQASRLEQFAVTLARSYVAAEDQGPPAAAYLAIRAARRALHANPDNARAYMLLGEAYQRLIYETRDRIGLAQLPRLERIRRVQAITAYSHALVLQPDLKLAHERLAGIFRSMNSGDLLLKHLVEQLRLEKADGPRPGEDAEQFKNRLAPLEKQVADVQTEVQKRLDTFELVAANYKVLDRAKEAIAKNLPGKALEVLEASDISAFGTEGMTIELELLLLTGRVREVREWMEPSHEEMIGVEMYSVLQLMMFAAGGDYVAADKELQILAAAADAEPRGGGPSPYRNEIATTIANFILDGAVVDGSPLRAVRRPLDRVLGIVQIQAQVNGLRQNAELVVIRGALALEVGDDAMAENLLRTAVDGLYVSDEVAAAGGGIDFGGRLLARRYLDLLARSKTR